MIKAAKDSSKVSNFLIEKLGNIELKIRPEDKYIFASDLCKAGGKLFAHYKENKQTEEFLKKLSMELEIPRHKLVEITRGGKNQGTWIHPKVAIHLAQWISADFSVKIASIVDEWSKQTPANEAVLLQAYNDIKPSMFKNQPELSVQKLLKNELGGETEVDTPVGRIDLLTSNLIIEIKHIDNWKHAIGQLMMYSLYYPNHHKCIYLFETSDKFIDKELICKHTEHIGISVVFYGKV